MALRSTVPMLRPMPFGSPCAKQATYLSHSRQTQRGGYRISLQPSRFIHEPAAAEIQRDGADPVADPARKSERATAGFAAIRALLDG